MASKRKADDPPKEEIGAKRVRRAFEIPYEIKDLKVDLNFVREVVDSLSVTQRENIVSVFATLALAGFSKSSFVHPDGFYQSLEHDCEVLQDELVEHRARIPAKDDRYYEA
jgi:hypothetical protein